MRCPECGHDQFSRPRHGPHAWRKTVESQGATFRVHVCLKCGRLLMSKQEMVTSAEAARILETLEEKQTTSYDLTPADVDYLTAGT